MVNEIENDDVDLKNGTKKIMRVYITMKVGESSDQESP